MRKNIFTSLRTLLRAVLSPLYTKQARAAKPKLSSRSRYEYETDDWMFEAEPRLDNQVNAYSSELSGLTNSLSGLHKTLTRMSGGAAQPIKLQPCAIDHHDTDLFDGEPAVVEPIQDTIIGGEGVYLFDDAPAFEDTPALHAA